MPQSLFILPLLSPQVLDLKGNSIYLDFEQIPFSPSLQSLRVSGTGITSLAGIGRATNLRRLHATDNLLNGTLPSELFDLHELRSLYLSFNSLEGSIPGDVSKLYNLQEVYLYGNKLEGSLPTEIGVLVNLRELVLARNHLTGTIPSEVSSMSTLEQLSLYDQQGGGRISGTLPTFANAVNLWYVLASFIHGSWRLKNSMLLANWFTFRFFDVSECDLTGT
jgi:Leucine-rich repeat (LRR) protein